MRTFLALIVGVLLAGCESGPRPIRYGEDVGAHCRMTISDPRFGAELVTATGKAYMFDSVECLAGYVLAHPERTNEANTLWVTSFDDSGKLIPLGEAFFLHAPALHSPMGRNLAAFGPGTTPQAALDAHGGEVLTWEEVLALVEGASSAGAVDSVSTLAETLERAAPGSRIVIPAGVYREPTLVLDKPVEIVGEGEVVLDGEGERVLLHITSDSVTVRGITFRNVGSSFVEDRAAVLVEKASHCTITGNRFEDTFFGIYLAEASHCTVSENTFRGLDARESRSGNGIHLWYSRHVSIQNNEIVGHRDGIYFEFVEDSIVEGNLSEGNKRYGLHFMFSDRCRYADNTFRANGAGVAVMYTEHVEMVGNRFEDNWGPAAFGLLLKDITDSRIVGNSFVENTVGLYAEGSNRIEITENRFLRNGWAVKIMADAMQNRFSHNNFIANSFDVGTNSRQSFSTFEENYWDAYEGYDLDRDGVGDVPFRPVRLFSLIVERHEPALLLMRSLFVQLLDLAERVAPALTPETLVDTRPLMRPRSL